MPNREYPAHPLVGVGAVVIHWDRVLLVQRARPPRLNMWTFPGGLVELGETVFQAAQRELEEETGVLGRPLEVVDVYEVIERDEDGRVRYHYVVVEVLLEYVSGDPTPRDDVRAVRWVPLEGLKDKSIGPGVREIVEKALSSRPGSSLW